MRVAQLVACPFSHRTARLTKSASLARQLVIPEHEVMFSSRDTPKLSDEELDSALVALPAWRAADDRKSITRSFVAKNFVKGARPIRCDHSMQKPHVPRIFHGCLDTTPHRRD